MQTYERHGVHLEKCDRCRGIFLDKGELEQLLAETGDPEPYTPPPVPTYQPPPMPPQTPVAPYQPPPAAPSAPAPPPYEPPPAVPPPYEPPPAVPPPYEPLPAPGYQPPRRDDHYREPYRDDPRYRKKRKKHILEDLFDF